MSVAEFLDWSTSRPEGERWELSGGVPVRVQSEKNRHNLLKTAVAFELGLSIRATASRCTLFGDGVTVVIDADHAYEPDAAVQCGGEVDLDGGTVETPVVIVEVLSPSTAYRDTGEKLEAYLGLPSVRHYLVFDPVRRVVFHHGRAEGGSPVVTTVLHGGTVELSPTGLTLDLDACFAVLREDG